jgi:CRP/FNR family transcriptional regulator, anaerobic regulatory protein
VSGVSVAINPIILNLVFEKRTMDYSRILGNVQKHVILEEKEISLFTSMLVEKQVARKDFILKEGEPCPCIYFVNEGALRAYYLDRDQNESIIMFALSDWWITDMHGFANQKPAMLNIDALEDSTVLELQKKDLDRLYEQVPKVDRFFRVVMQNAYIREQLRVMQNLSMTAEERYEAFLKKYPQFAQRIPLKQIASYLGMTPEFLSVVRKKKTQK